MNLKKPLILFDMDGTLLDTRHDIARAANNARVELGLSPMTVDDVVRAVGDGVNLFVSRVTFSQEDERFPRARSVFMRHYAQNVTGATAPYAGINELLKALHAREQPMAIVSNKPAALVDELVIHFGWQKYFGTWLGGDSAARPKPAAEPLIMARDLCGLDMHHPMVMVGDGPQDVLAAKSASCRAVWVSWGFNRDIPVGYESTRIDHPRDLLSVVEK